MSAEDVDRALAVFERVKALVPNKANLPVGHGEILAEEVIRLRGLIDTNGDREFIERRFREGLREAELDTHGGGPATCPYDATPLAGLWWTRGYVYGESVRLRAERDSWSHQAIRLSRQMTEVLARSEAAEQQLTALRQMVWQPIETAPRDGVKIITWAAGWDWPISAFWWDGNSQEPCGWRASGIGLVYPTHWMSWPSPPLLTAQPTDR